MKLSYPWGRRPRPAWAAGLHDALGRVRDWGLEGGALSVFLVLTPLSFFFWMPFVDGQGDTLAAWLLTALFAALAGPVLGVLLAIAWVLLATPVVLLLQGLLRLFVWLAGWRDGGMAGWRWNPTPRALRLKESWRRECEQSGPRRERYPPARSSGSLWPLLAALAVGWAIGASAGEDEG